MTWLHRMDTSLGPIQAAFDAEGALIYLGFAGHEFRTALLAELAGHGPLDRPGPATG